VDGVAAPPGLCHLLIAANTARVGGGMRAAPAADPADGALDLVTVGPVSRGTLVRLLALAYWGRHVGRPGVTVRRIRRLEAEGQGRWPLNLDGEVWKALPARIEILPGVLSVLVPGP
jgi:diacylglycerol kinase (ATP)